MTCACTVTKFIKHVASIITTAKVMLDHAARRIQSMVRRYLSRARKHRLLEIKSMSQRRNHRSVSTFFFTVSILLFHGITGVTTIIYCIKFDPERKRLWEDTITSVLILVYLFLQPIVIVGSEICYNGWWYDLFRHASRWAEWVFIENDMV